MSNKKPSNLWIPGQTGSPKGRPPDISEITKLRVWGEGAEGAEGAPREPPLAQSAGGRLRERNRL